MIIFHKVRWKNFLSTGDVFTEIELDRNDATLIVGHNGSGKSSLLASNNSLKSFIHLSHLLEYYTTFIVKSQLNF